jgi:DNA-binding NtrC family response regulator
MKITDPQSLDVQRKRILLVEPNPYQRFTFTTIFENDYNVEKAKGVERGLEMLDELSRNSGLHFIVSDAVFSDGDFTAFTTYMEERHMKIPLVLCADKTYPLSQIVEDMGVRVFRKIDLLNLKRHVDSVLQA